MCICVPAFEQYGMIVTMIATEHDRSALYTAGMKRMNLLRCVMLTYHPQGLGCYVRSTLTHSHTSINTHHLRPIRWVCVGSNTRVCRPERLDVRIPPSREQNVSRARVPCKKCFYPITALFDTLRPMRNQNARKHHANTMHTP